MDLDDALSHLQVDGWYVMSGVIPADQASRPTRGVRPAARRCATVVPALGERGEIDADTSSVLYRSPLQQGATSCV